MTPPTTAPTGVDEEDEKDEDDDDDDDDVLATVFEVDAVLEVDVTEVDAVVVPASNLQIKLFGFRFRYTSDSRIESIIKV